MTDGRPRGRLCPMCSSDWMRPARVTQTGQPLLVCVECSSAWPSPKEHDALNAVDLQEFLSGCGIQGGCDALTYERHPAADDGFARPDGSHGLIG